MAGKTGSASGSKPKPAKAAAKADASPLKGFIRRSFRRLSWKWRLAVLAPTAVGALGLAGFAGMMLYYTVAFPDPLSLRQKERAPVVRILARDGAVLAERGMAHDYMPLDLLPRHVTAAVVATEDRRFHEHWGIDPSGLVRAAFANLRAGRVAQGGSTLTQQLAKNLFLSPERTMARKLEELLLALWLELRLSKRDILELYLNRVYFGGGAYGIEAAAQRYFDKSARGLTLAEAALVAGLLKAPSKYSPAASPGLSRTRGRVVLMKMRGAGVITQEQETRAARERIKFAALKPSRDGTGPEYAVDFALERLPPLLGSGHAEVVVETTIDASLQRRAQKIVQSEIARQGAALLATQAAVVVLDGEGGIRALVGGTSYQESQFNRATKARRQPGSAFKPFVYLTALEAGQTPDTTVYDLPLTVDGWAPRNDNGQYKGAMTLGAALRNSVNTVAVRLLLDSGAHRVAQAARRLGIRSELRERASLALGTSEVTLLELTGAYGVLAGGGASIETHIIRRVRMSSGRILYAREAPRSLQVVAPVHVAAMNGMLNAAIVHGTGRRAQLPRHRAAGKTGTTQDFRDAWFVGYTSHLTAGVWVGNDQGTSMNRVTGGSLPAEIWREVMMAGHEGRAPVALPGTMRVPDTIPAAEPHDQPAASAPAPAAKAPLAPLPPPGPPVIVAPALPSRQQASLPQPAREKPAAMPAAGPVLPKERIDEDFIARALAPQQSEPQQIARPAAPAIPPAGGAGFDVEEISKQLADEERTRPSGLMSLGARR